MKSQKYTILLANRTTGAVRRLTIARPVGVVLLAGLTAIPLLIGLGASRIDPVELETLRLANETLRLENDSYRASTGELANQVLSLQSALTELADAAELDPNARAALSRLPAGIRRPAVGGGAAVLPARATPAVAEVPDSTIGVLRNLLRALEDELATVKNRVENQQARLRATPSILPLAGWLSSGFGRRIDPFDGSPDFHSGVDIAADRGTPVRATADGTVESAGLTGDYGNAIVVDHGYGIGTRFGHLLRVAVSTGQAVRRGEIIGYVGSTGRATSPHLHYEILVNGNPINPFRILARP